MSLVRPLERLSERKDRGRQLSHLFLVPFLEGFQEVFQVVI